ncbi:hypothetical protein BGZ65_003322, partial [Modicella reniformis]
MSVRLRGDLNCDAWQRALNTLFARHEALRSIFVTVNGEPRVNLLSAQSGIPISWKDLRGQQDAETQLERISIEEASAPFDLAQGPLIRVVMVQLDNAEHQLLLTQHHIVSDGWSMAIMCNELNALYTAYCMGEPDPLPPLTIQYPDFAVWQKQWLSGERLEAHSSYWRKALADSPVLINLPTDRPRPVQQSFAGKEIQIRLDPQLTRALKDMSQKHGTTLYMTIMTAWSAVLSRLSGQDDIIIGSPTANRNNHQIESLIGFFVNTLALRVDMSGDPTVRQLLERVRSTTIDAQAHQDLPFEQVVEIVQLPRNMSHSPLFQVMFVWQSNEESEWNLPKIETLEVEPTYDVARFDLTLQLFESDNGITGSLGYSTAIFDQSTMERHVGYLCTMLEAMVADVDRVITAVELIAPAEREMLLRTWNATEKDYPSHLCIHQLFEQQVERTPEATALVFTDQSLTYAEVNTRANQLAHHLIELGVLPDMRVAICVERSCAMVVAALAVLKIGGTYVPLDPTYASKRLSDILVDSATMFALADNAGRAAIGEESLSAMTVFDPNTSLNERSNKDKDSNPQVPGLTSRHLAYIIYTSGSTGKPKGVLIEHQGVVNFLMSRQDVYGIHQGSRVLQFSSFGFDGSVMDIFATLGYGGTIYLLPDHIRYVPAQLWDYLRDHSITQAFLPPALLRDCIDLPPLSNPLTMIVGGESYPASLLRALQALFPNGTILNEYGPTETTIIAASWRFQEDYTGDIPPIGRPLSNRSFYILDKHQNPVPLGAAGELFIGGVGVARGYLNRPELTSQVFVHDPFAGAADARMYKTGDLGRYLPDGNICVLGRNDHQVKIRGFRIELGEVEARLTDHDLVDKAIVVAMDHGNQKRLVAYVAAEKNDHLVFTLRSHLASCLPDYMVPSAIVRMDSLPLTLNGKIDRKALPAPDLDAFARQDYEEPHGEIEITIAQMWSELLHVDRVSRNDNFFSLGGHSLLAVRLMNRITELGVQLPLSMLFASPCLSAFAECVNQQLGQGDNSLQTIVPVSREGDLPISFAQQRMWFLAQLEGVSETYHMSMSVHLQGDLNCDAWQCALNTLFARHEALRSVFVTVNGEPQVRLLSAQSGIPICWKDLRGQPDAETKLERISAEETSAPFDLAQGPLIRVVMVQLDNDEHQLLLTQHHIVSDGWSMAILCNELNALYTAYCMCEPDPLLPLTIQYPDFAAWQKQWLSGDRLEAHNSYWRTVLADAPVLINLPTDRPRPAQQSFAGKDIQIRLNPQLTRSLKDLSQKHGTTMYMTILTAWSAVLARLSGQDDIIIGSPTANRNNPQIESLIGFFVNTLALRVDLSGDPTVRQLLDRVRSTTLDAQAHQDLPFEQVVDIVQPPRSMSHSPLFQVMFVWQNNEESEWHLPMIETLEVDPTYEVTKFDLTLQLYESDEGISGSLGYSTALFDQSTMERHVGYLCAMLEAITTDVDRVITAVEIIAPAERDLLLRTWNETKQDYPSHLCIHQLFEPQVERTPHATALVFMGQSMTYAELNTRANKLAHHLIELGVRPDSRVAICVERSFAMIVGVIAILKAGGAYIPLDPAYASERLRDILADAATAIIVADKTGRGVLQDETLGSLTVVDPNSVLDVCNGSERSNGDIISLDHRHSNPEIAGLTSRHLAYIIYTSGSTGKPKGVTIEHQGAVNLIHSRPKMFGLLPSSRAVQFTSLSFDHSVSEIFSALTCGASLHLVPDEVRLDQQRLWSYFKEHSITHVSITPTLLQDNKDLPPLETPLTFVIMGEALPASLIPQVFAIVPNGRIINDYGPTEISVATTVWECPRDFTGDIVPIGRPIPNKSIYILDKYSQPVPLGAVGELYIGGVGVARGYLNQPELSAKVFLRDPFSADAGARMYKTGDVARYLPDGTIEYLGRNDHQVKIRGFRIELGEIEARLTDHILVDNAVVLALGEGS